MVDREITILLHDGISDENYAKLANVIWSVADLAGEDFVGVLPDGGTTDEYLNDWYDDKDGSARWGDKAVRRRRKG
ncbi:hypothetical protein ACFY36_05440 [Actinoplanes sp. NPDC000266]